MPGKRPVIEPSECVAKPAPFHRGMKLQSSEPIPLPANKLRMDFGEHDALDNRDLGALLRLQSRAWLANPACSLENDYNLLKRIACLPDKTRHATLRDIVANDFVLCDDGRLYSQYLTPIARDIFKRGYSRPPADVWAKLRDSVFSRDNYTCAYCSQRGGNLECDHIVPAHAGGPAVMSNLITACSSCNRQKSYQTAWGYIEALKVRANG